jgi:Flp pilus assembly pilin Flp
LFSWAPQDERHGNSSEPANLVFFKEQLAVRRSNRHLLLWDVGGNDLKRKQGNDRGHIMLTKIKNTQLATALAGFHNEEDGVEAIQVVLILAIAAIALIGVKWAWNEADANGEKGIEGMFKSQTEEALKFKFQK